MTQSVLQLSEHTTILPSSSSLKQTREITTYFRKQKIDPLPPFTSTTVIIKHRRLFLSKQHGDLQVYERQQNVLSLFADYLLLI